jgi:Protein of unknown function
MHRQADAARGAGRTTRVPGVSPRDARSEESPARPAPPAVGYGQSSSSWWHDAFAAVPWNLERIAARLSELSSARWARHFGIALGIVAAVCMLVAGALWALLAAGPISLDVATPWLQAAIAENLGDQFGVEVGGTVVERDEHGRAAMRMRGIIVRDRDGTVIASAPKAEIGFSSASLLRGRPRAERLKLVGAELAVRVESDGRISVSTGAEKRPLATTPVLAPIETRPVSSGPDRAGERGSVMQQNFAAFLAWVDRLGAFGLDGGDLTEVGLKSGNLVVDDLRNGRQSRFENIHLSLMRPRAGALEFELGSEDTVKPWSMSASLKPGVAGMRDVDFEVSRLSLKNLMLALRIDGGPIDVDVPVSANLRAEIDPDGTPHTIGGRMLAGPGAITDLENPAARIAIDRAEMTLDWNAEKRALAVPFQIVSGGTRMTLTARAEAPREANGTWAMSLSGGSVVLPPQSPADDPLQLNRIQVRGRFDPVVRRLSIIDAEVSGKGVGVALSGNVDFSTSDPRINIGLAARNMSLAAFKQMWPPFINPTVRDWVIERTRGGTIEQAEIATNTPVSALRDTGPPVPDDGLYIQITSAGGAVRPFDDLPEIRDADLVTRIKGRSATVSLGRGAIEMPSGRRLTLANGTFEVADTVVKNPPAKVRARVEGPVAAAAELLNMDRIRDAASIPIDPATSRGNVVATLNLAMPLTATVKPGSLVYTIGADIVNFSADRLIAGQKVEAQTMRATATNQGYQIRGEMRVGGAPATVELRHTNGETDAELRLSGTLDDAARNRLGLDPVGGIIGSIPIKVGGRVAFSGDQDSRLLFEADFTPARIDNLLPGWNKPSGRAARASFVYVGRGKPTRFDDISFDGGGAALRGAAEFDQNGDFSAATFTNFALSEGDRANLRLERTTDNLYRATLRGDAFDARGFIKATMAGSGETRTRRPTFDFDLDAKLAAVTGAKNEGLRNVDLHLVRRGGAIRNLALSARFVGEGTLQGELRGKPGERPIVLIESTDAGALFRLTDTYSRMVGGQAWIAIDPPTVEGTRQDGLLEVRDFAVRGEQGLDGVATGAPNGANNGVQFSHMRVSFTRSPGKMSIHEGLVTGPAVGATIDGVMDYTNNELHMRGTFVPLFGLNSAFRDVPIVGFLLGGKEGLIGSMTYEVVGSPGAPILHVNPISMVAPGFVRKLLEFPSSLPNDRRDPWRQ